MMLVTAPCGRDRCARRANRRDVPRLDAKRRADTDLPRRRRQNLVLHAVDPVDQSQWVDLSRFLSDADALPPAARRCQTTRLQTGMRRPERQLRASVSTRGMTERATSSGERYSAEPVETDGHLLALPPLSSRATLSTAGLAADPLPTGRGAATAAASGFDAGFRLRRLRRRSAGYFGQEDEPRACELIRDFVVDRPASREPGTVPGLEPPRPKPAARRCREA